MLVECVVNVSEGRDEAVIAAVAAAGGPAVVDLHRDGDHHRSVLTLAGPEGMVAEAARAVAAAAVARIDISAHSGAHPRIGAVDVVPWVALGPATPGRAASPAAPSLSPVAASGSPAGLAAAAAARDRFGRWAGTTLGLPCFAYGPERSLPDLRRTAWTSLAPDFGPDRPHPTAGACAVGARPVLVAYNLWLAEPDLAAARSVAAAVRGPHLRALGLAVGTGVQVSCNLIAPAQVGPGAAFDAVASRVAVARAELVGLVPQEILAAEPPARWPELGLDPSTTIEARLEQAGLDGGRFDHSG